MTHSLFDPHPNREHPQPNFRTLLNDAGLFVGNVAILPVSGPATTVTPTTTTTTLPPQAPVAGDDEATVTGGIPLTL
jgi:hypothetical protein